jgi:hypothetical protein
MSDEQEHDIAKFIGTLKWVVTLGWALLAGAFSLGIWATSLQLGQAELRAKLVEQGLDVKAHHSEINSINLKQAVNQSDLAYIRTTVDRIEKKLP